MIRAINLCKKFGGIRAIDNLSFEIEKGRVAILGFNGAGKSTLAKLVAGILKPSSGKIEVFGKSPSSSPDVRARIGIASHNPMLYRELTARENLEFYSRIYRSDVDLEDLAERLGFKKMLDRRVSELSRGFVQRVAFARALLNSPEILILDEITAGLDVASREVILDIVSQHRYVLFTTHTLEEAEFCDTFIVLTSGRLSYMGESFEEALKILS